MPKVLGYQIVAVLTLVVFAIGCSASVDQVRRADSITQAHAATDRKLVRSGDLAVFVDSIDATAAAVEGLVKEAGGFVERSNETRESDAWMLCRVPAANLDAIMDAVANLGEERHRSVSAADVTDQYTDLEVRLRNNIALLDRLRNLLERASNVEDTLAIEKELNRVQSEVEAMQARFDRLTSQVEYSALTVKLERERVLGPLSYVGKGFWWVVSKLFVIR